eukprot:GDKK01043767.1.p1 GENE.GDKK01043767.1~~GDKK01043767.1.p1  ORF type:complete len:341 (+),score=50.53 GDKK01043767.1:172-1194(+)
MTEVATDYNALFTGALASFVGQNCKMNYGSPTYTTTAPATTATPSSNNGQYALSPIKIEEWWLQLTISPTPYSATAIISNSATGASNTWVLEGPRWGQHWTASPTVAITDADRIAIIVYSSSSATGLQSILREGALGISAVLSDNVENFAEDAFVVAVAAALNIDESRVQVNSVQAGSVTVDFNIATMPNTLYTVAGTKLCLSGSSGQCQIPTRNTAFETQLNDNTSSLSVSLASALGSAESVSVVRSATAGAAAPDNNNGGGDVPANTGGSDSGLSSTNVIIIVVVVAGVLLLAVAAVGGVIVFKNSAKSKRTVTSSEKYENDEEIKEKLNPVTRTVEV